MNETTHIKEYFASCPKHIEALLLDEITTLGGTEARETVAGVYFSASNSSVLYKVCLWSRLANRILMPLSRGPVNCEEDLYQLASKLEWEQYFAAEASFVVDFSGTNDAIRHTQFGAQRVKDAVVDRFQQHCNARPRVDKEAPDVRLNVRLNKSQAVMSIDMSGDSLHRRGYRARQGSAPLKENLAAALLIRAGITSQVASAKANKQPLVVVDPMCGSATLLIEAGLIARNIAPGFLRKKFGFEQLLNHDVEQWHRVREEAATLRVDDDQLRLQFYGYDSDESVISLAKQNVEDAGLSADIHLQRRALQAFATDFADTTKSGLLICNPPYGERLGEVEQLRGDYQMLGQVLKRHFAGFTCAVFTSNSELGGEMRLRARNRYKFFNGPIAAELLMFDIQGAESRLREDFDLSTTPLSEGAMMVANRLKKNKKRLEKWVNANAIECYRLYDADMPEYSAAVDIYGNYAHVQEYQAPKNIEESKTQKRFKELLHALTQTLGFPEKNIIAKMRMRHKGKSQYEKRTEFAPQHTLQVQEGRAKFWINLQDYLDTGLFLDHRPLRRMLYEGASGKSFLNLFCYTASASVHAALGGAKRSVSVDMSNTYLRWARENFELNNIRSARHELVRGDCIAWLKDCREGFDLIMLDPPTFSNSKNTETVLDILRDHVALISRCMEILNPGGTLYFSTNHRSFKLDNTALTPYAVTDISQQTLDPDFEKNSKIHRCWQIQHKE